MALWETMRGIVGEILLFLFVGATVAAMASVLDMSDSLTPEEAAAVAASFTILAGIIYASRTYWDEGKWKRFLITSTLSPTLVILAIANAAHTINIDLVTAIVGTVSVLTASSVVAGIVYVLRLVYLIPRWSTKRQIKKHSNVGNHHEAIQEAEKARCWLFQRRNYVENPANFSCYKSAALRLAQSLDAVGKSRDATRVRLVANGWTVDQVNSLLDEQARLTYACRLHLHEEREGKA